MKLLFGDVEAKKRARKTSADPRHQPFIQFAFESYRQARGETLVIDGRSIKAVAEMLKATNAHPDEYSLERLQAFWLCSMEKASAFDRTQPPLVWFSRNLNRWVSECNAGRPKTGVDVTRDWMRKKLGK